jgi:hypothetical protein
MHSATEQTLEIVYRPLESLKPASSESAKACTRT